MDAPQNLLQLVIFKEFRSKMVALHKDWLLTRQKSRSKRQLKVITLKREYL
jgi:hypothetical protein